MCVVFCKKCEAENVLIVVQIWAEVVLLGCQVSLIVLFLILVCKQSLKTVIHRRHMNVVQCLIFQYCTLFCPTSQESVRCLLL